MLSQVPAVDEEAYLTALAEAARLYEEVSGESARICSYHSSSQVL